MESAPRPNLSALDGAMLRPCEHSGDGPACDACFHRLMRSVGVKHTAADITLMQIPTQEKGMRSRKTSFFRRE